MSNIEALAIDFLKQLENCPYDTDGDINTRQENMMKVQACLRISRGIESSNHLLDSVVDQLDTESVEAGLRGIRKYSRDMHSSVVANLNLHSKLIYQMMTETPKRRKRRK